MLAHPPVTDPPARQDRLDALSDWERQLLLAYLDGRVPAFIDEWFERRALGPPVRSVLPRGYTSPPGLARAPSQAFALSCG